MSPSTGYATKDELYLVKHDLSKRIGDVEMALKWDISRLYDRIEQVETGLTREIQHVEAKTGGEMRRVEQNMMSMFAALFAHLVIDTPPLK